MAKRNDVEELYEVIAGSSLDRWYIIHQNFFVNHLSHAQVALFQLGAPIDKIRSYTKRLSEKFDPKGGKLNQRDDAKVESFASVDDLLGKGSRFYVVLDHFKDIFISRYNGNLDEFVAGEFPKVYKGVGDYAIHPLIHLGYGYAVRSAVLVIEGMAFLHFGYFGMELESYSPEKLGQGSKSLLEIAEMIQNDDSIYNRMNEITEGKTFIPRMRAVMANCGDDILKLVHQLDCPRESGALMNWILDNMITLYTMAENRNDFFILHGITSAWALSQFLQVIKTEEKRLEILQVFLCVLLAVYIGKDRPKLNAGYLGNGGEMEMTWEELRSRVVDLPDTTEEHRFKLVQVCYETALRNPSMAAVCMQAAFTSLDFHFHVGSFSESKRFTLEEAKFVH